MPPIIAAGAYETFMLGSAMIGGYMAGHAVQNVYNSTHQSQANSPSDTSPSSNATNSPATDNEAAGKGANDGLSGDPGNCGTGSCKEDPNQKQRQEERRKRLQDRLDNIKEHTTDRDLDAAQRELDGETVATKADGTPYDHVAEVKDAQNGLQNIIDSTKAQLGSPNLVPSEAGPYQDLLGQASNLLDKTRQFVPRGS